MCVCQCRHWDSDVCLSGACARIILVLREPIWNTLVLPVLDDIGSLGSPPRQVVYPLGFMVPPWVTASCSLVGSREAEMRILVPGI